MDNKGINLTTIVMQRQDIDASDLNGEKVMMNLDKGQYFALNDVGSRIWEIISKSVTVREIVEILLAEYDIDEKTCSNSVASFLESMRNAELINIG